MPKKLYSQQVSLNFFGLAASRTLELSNQLKMGSKMIFFLRIDKYDQSH
jgi:hypothetical protein